MQVNQLNEVAVCGGSQASPLISLKRFMVVTYERRSSGQQFIIKNALNVCKVFIYNILYENQHQ